MRQILLVLATLSIACSKPVPREVALAACAPAGTKADSATIAGCLEGQYKWSADSAATAAHQISESLAVVRQRLSADSIAAAQAEQVLAGANSATDDVKSVRGTDDVALAMIWVGSKRSKLYFRGHCAAARAVKGADREQFSNDKMAEREGYRRSTVPADSVCYQTPGF